MGPPGILLATPNMRRSTTPMQPRSRDRPTKCKVSQVGQPQCQPPAMSWDKRVVPSHLQNTTISCHMVFFFLYLTPVCGPRYAMRRPAVIEMVQNTSDRIANTLPSASPAPVSTLRDCSMLLDWSAPLYCSRTATEDPCCCLRGPGDTG